MHQPDIEGLGFLYLAPCSIEVPVRQISQKQEWDRAWRNYPNRHFFI